MLFLNATNNLSSALVLTVLFATATAAATTACGGTQAVGAGDAGTSEAGTFTEEALTQACQLQSRVNRERAKRCGGVETNAAESGDAEVEACKGYYRLPGLGDTPELAKACATALETAACDEASARRACPPTPDGMLAVGVSCESPSQCKTGLCRVDISTSGSLPKCGVCEARRADGATCPVENVYDPCQVGSACIGAQVGTNVVGTCTKSLPIGAACKTDGGPVCTGSSCIDGTCQARHALGAACTRNAECIRGLVCGDKTCRNPSFKEPGAACTNISTDRCAVGFSCFTPDVDGGGDAPSFCPALLALGDRCDDTDGSKTCPVFSGCYGGKCTRNWGDPVCR